MEEEPVIIQMARFIVKHAISNWRQPDRPTGETKICMCCKRKYDSASFTLNPSGFPHTEDCLYKKAQAVVLLTPEK